MKIEVFIFGEPRIDQKRKKGWWRGRRESIEKGSRERIEKRDKRELSEQFEEEDMEHRHLPLLVVQFPAFLLSFRLDSAVP